MSFLSKLILIIFYSILFSTLSLLNESQNYNDFLYTKHSSVIESYFDKIITYKNFSSLGFSNNFFFNLLVLADEFLRKTKAIPIEYFRNRNFTNCFNQMLQMFSESDLSNFIFIFESNGKYLNDLGNENYCITRKDTEYYLLQSYFNSTQNLTSSEDISLLEFLDQNYFSFGFCFPNKCSNMTHQLLFEDKQFMDYIFWQFKVSNFSFHSHSETLNEFKNKFKSGKIIMRILYSIILIKLLVGLLRSIIIPKGYERCYIDNLEKEKKKKSISLVSVDTRREENETNKKKEKEKEDEKNEKRYLIEKEDENENKKEYEKNLEETKSLSERIRENNNDKREIYLDYIYGSSSKNEHNLYNPFYDNQDKYSLYLKIVKCIDLIDNIKILIKLTNKYYNSCNIKKIYFLKFIVMFMTVVLKVMLSQIRMPSKNFLVYNFYLSPFFILIKFCIFSSVFWIVLDAVTTGFKLMSYIKKKMGCSKNNNLTFLSMTKFLLLLIPKLFIFILYYFLLHIYSKHLTFSLITEDHLGPFIIYGDINYNNTYSARFSSDNFTNQIKHLLPIWINYLDYFYEYDLNKKKDIAISGDNSTNENNSPNYTYYVFDRTRLKIPSPFLTNTELFINVYLNEFVLFFFMLLITYLSYKFRSKIFDYFILIINIVLYILPIFNLTKYDFSNNTYENVSGELKEKKEYQKYTIHYVLGQYFSEKYTHYFINFYYFGFIIGVMMFYYYENIYSQYSHLNTINNNSNGSSRDWSYDGTGNLLNINNNFLNALPFSFCNDFIMVLNKLHFYIKRIILWICILFFILISLSFTIIQKIKPNMKNEKIINLNINEIYIPIFKNYIIQFIFLYEKNLCCIFFFIFLLMFILYPPNTNLVKISKINFFVLFDRINFSFYCTYSYFIYAAFCVFYVEFKITPINMFLNSLGLFFLLIAINIFTVCTFELPIRMIIKAQMNKNVEKEFQITASNFALFSPSNRTTTSFKK